MERPELQLTSITIGTDDPHGLAEFYRELLGWQVTGDDPPDRDEDPGWAQLKPRRRRAGADPQLRGRASVPSPDVAVGRGCPERDPAPRHLGAGSRRGHRVGRLSVGAVLADVQPQDDVRVLFDPSGHPFCLFR